MLPPSAHALNAQRYYTYAGQTVAQRTSTGLQFLTGDPHGTSTIAIADTTTQAAVKRYQDPYGNNLTTSGGVWTGPKSFVGGDSDPTALIHEGAREYDPQLGRFISHDPATDPQKSSEFNGDRSAEIGQNSGGALPGQSDAAELMSGCKCIQVLSQRDSLTQATIQAISKTTIATPATRPRRYSCR